MTCDMYERDHMTYMYTYERGGHMTCDTYERGGHMTCDMYERGGHRGGWNSFYGARDPSRLAR